MIITAKFASVCPCCNVRIIAGSKVEWSKGNAARHVACTGPAVAKAPVAARSYRRPMGAGHGAAAAVAGYSRYCTDNASCRCYDCAS